MYWGSGSGTADADKFMEWYDTAGTVTYHVKVVSLAGGGAYAKHGGTSLTFTTAGGAVIWDAPDYYMNANQQGIAAGTYEFNASRDVTRAFTWRGGGYGIGWSASDTVVYISTLPCWNGATPTAGPTAGPTGTPGLGYCASVPSAVDIDLSDLPDITLGEASCASIGPFTINLSGISWLPGLSSIESVGLPEISLCLREIYFGGVTVFGMRFDLDILSAVITCVLALRWVFRS